MSETRRYLKQALVSFLFIFTLDGLSLWKENRNGLSESHLLIGQKKKRKYTSKRRGGCRRRENGGSLIRLGAIYLKVVHVGLLAIQCMDFATQETPSGDEKQTNKCPVHNSTSHASEECKKFKELPTLEKEKPVQEHKRFLSCLLPGHRLHKCNVKNRCKVEGCAMRHRTLDHEVDLNITERSRYNLFPLVSSRQM